MHLLIAAGVAAALLLGLIAPADAATLRCGMTLRSKAKLTADLDCTGFPPITLLGQ